MKEKKEATKGRYGIEIPKQEKRIKETKPSHKGKAGLRFP